MKLACARVSTGEQNLDLQRQALTAAGCEVILEDHGVPGTAAERPGLASALARLERGDVLVVWRLDRLSRSLAQLIHLIDGVDKAGAGFQSLCESIDTTTAGGRLVVHDGGAGRVRALARAGPGGHAGRQAAGAPCWQAVQAYGALNRKASLPGLSNG